MTEKWVLVKNTTMENSTLARARWCDSTLCRLRGLTFRGPLKDQEGLILVEPVESRIGTSIHMMGVFFSLGVVWINAQNLVVDKRLARPGGFYFPGASARYVLEAEPAILNRVKVGDFLEFTDAP
ncbi:MAG: DUF192 domain-containing protein [Anaerolineales bacterium]|nr:DUF192 domain-containing protein [Anaerolineales bacterium]